MREHEASNKIMTQPLAWWAVGAVGAVGAGARVGKALDRDWGRTINQIILEQ